MEFLQNDSDNLDLVNHGINSSNEEEENNNLKKNKTNVSFITYTGKNINIDLDLENDDINEEVNKYCLLHNYSDVTRDEIINYVFKIIDENIANLCEEEEIENDSFSIHEDNNSEVNDNEYSQRINESSYEDVSENINDEEEEKKSNSSNENKIEKLEENNNVNQKNIKNKNLLDKRKQRIKKKKDDKFVKKYYNQIEVRKEKNKKREQEENEKCMNEIKEYFKPKINNYSKILYKSSDICKKYKNMKVEDRLIEQGKEHKKKCYKKFTQFHLSKDSEKRSHTPNINPYKYKKKRDKDVFNHLFQYDKEYEDKKRDLKKKYYDEQYPFKPDITKKSTKYFENIVYPKEKEEIFTEIKIKILKPKKNKVEKKKKLKKFEENKLDDKKSLASNREYTLSKKNWMETVNRIIEKERMKKCKTIFDMLDNDNDNIISYNKINTANLNANLLKPIIPVIQEIIEKKEETVTFKEFYERIKKYLN